MSSTNNIQPENLKLIKDSRSITVEIEKQKRSLEKRNHVPFL